MIYHHSNHELIPGEHIDYVLFGFIPAAIESDVLMAVGAREEHDPGRVTAENEDSKYTRQTFAPRKDSNNQWSLDIDKLAQIITSRTKALVSLKFREACKRWSSFIRTPKHYGLS